MKGTSLSLPNPKAIQTHKAAGRSFPARLMSRFVGAVRNLLAVRKPEFEFYELLNAQAEAAVRAAQRFYVLTGDFALLTTYLEQLEAIEHEADELHHALVNKVNTQFITPLDKEDLHGLSDRLDDIVDNIEDAAERLRVYRLAAPRPELQPLVGLTVTIAQETQKLVAHLRSGLSASELSAIVGGIHAIERRSDKIFRQALSDLLDDEGMSAGLLIKWKDVYERIENATNACEKLAGFIESLMVKYA